MRSDAYMCCVLQMANCLNGATHGPVHIMIGGAWGNSKVTEDSDLQFLDVSASSLPRFSFLVHHWNSVRNK